MSDNKLERCPVCENMSLERGWKRDADEYAQCRRCRAIIPIGLVDDLRDRLHRANKLEQELAELRKLADEVGYWQQKCDEWEVKCMDLRIQHERLREAANSAESVLRRNANDELVAPATQSHIAANRLHDALAHHKPEPEQQPTPQPAQEGDGVLTTLRIRNLIAAREANTAAANRELQSGDDWLCDHAAIDRELADQIAGHLDAEREVGS